MIKIIQTNLSINDDSVIMDYQVNSYYIDSWDEFIEGVKEGEFKVTNPTLPMERRINKKILNTKHDTYHMVVDYEDGTKSMFYVVR